MASELKNIYRVPKININLPSGKDFYHKDTVNLSIDNSLPIRAMTARDELMLKSPDALLNGDCLVHIIQSCVPEISDPKQLLAPDVEAILLGIFYASYGPKIEFKAKCPTCEHENHFEVEIRHILDTASILSLPASVEKDLGTINNIPTKIITFVKPYTFETNTRHQLQLFEHSKMLQVLSDDKSEDEKKLAVFNECFAKIVNIKFENVVQCINHIEIHEQINSEWRVNTITNSEDIEDMIFNADSALVEPIIEKIDHLNESGVKNDFDAICQNTKCKHEWNARVEFNPVNFFVKGSYHSRPTKLKNI